MNKSKAFTFMLLSEKSGRHYAAKLSLTALLIMLVAGVGLVVMTVVSITGYLEIRRVNSEYFATIAQQKIELNSLTDEREEAVMYKEWADRIIYRRLHFEDRTGKGSSSSAHASLDGEVPNGAMKTGYRLDVDEFDVRRINLDLDFEVSFKLINRSRGKKVIGYIYIIASNDDVVPVMYDSWPQVEIISGLPNDFKKGVNFSIRYLKGVKGRINQPDIGSKFNRVDLIAYSDDGNIMMKKGFYIERLLKQSPYE